MRWKCVTIWKRAVLLRTFVGAKMETLMVASSGQSVLRVCAQFGNYVKIRRRVNLSWRILNLSCYRTRLLSWRPLRDACNSETTQPKTKEWCFKYLFVLNVCFLTGCLVLNTVTTLEGSSYLIITLVVIIIITARPHTLDWLLWTGNKHFITSGLSCHSMWVVHAYSDSYQYITW